MHRRTSTTPPRRPARPLVGRDFPFLDQMREGIAMRAQDAGEQVLADWQIPSQRQTTDPPFLGAVAEI